MGAGSISLVTEEELLDREISEDEGGDIGEGGETESLLDTAGMG